MSEPIQFKKCRFRITSKDGETALIDLSTGEHLNIVSLKFEHASRDDRPELTITLVDFELEGEIDVTTLSDKAKRSRRNPGNLPDDFNADTFRAEGASLEDGKVDGEEELARLSAAELTREWKLP